MHRYEITATLWRLKLDDAGDEIDREKISEDVVNSSDNEAKMQAVFDFLVTQ